MSRYQYDALLTAHFEKSALLGAVKAVGKTALKGVQGATIGGGGVAGTVGLGAATFGPIALGGDAFANSPARRAVTASLREMAHVHNMQKHAEHGLKDKLLHIAPYAAWGLGAGLEGTGLAQKHPWLPKALSAGAYLGYAGRSAYDAYKHPSERITGAIDAAALLAMLGADVARWRRPATPGP